VVNRASVLFFTIFIFSPTKLASYTWTKYSPSVSNCKCGGWNRIETWNVRCSIMEVCDVAYKRNATAAIKIMRKRVCQQVCSMFLLMNCIRWLYVFLSCSRSFIPLNCTYKLSYGFLYKLSHPCICFRELFTPFCCADNVLTTAPACEVVRWDLEGAGRRALWEGRDVVCSPAWAHNYCVCTLKRDSILINILHLNCSCNHTTIPEND
jgi:hypothetical protein